MKNICFFINYLLKISITVIVVLFLSTVLLAGCSNTEYVRLPQVEDYKLPRPAQHQTNLKIGIAAGPYLDMLNIAILPLLQDKGYSIDIVLFDNDDFSNISLINNDIDMNIIQHYSDLNDYKFNNDAALSAIAELPTAPMVVYSNSLEHIDEIKRGSVIGIPEDPSELTRALQILNNAGIIRLDHLANKRKAALENIVSNPKNVVLETYSDSTDVLSNFDLTVIDGTIAINKGLSLGDALFVEVPDTSHLLVAAVRTEDLNKNFVRDFIRVLHSDSYRDIITEPDSIFARFQRPFNFYFDVNL